MKRKLKLLIPALLALVVVFFIPSMTNLAEPKDAPVDSLVIYADLHTNKDTNIDNLVNTSVAEVFNSANDVMATSASSVISAGDSWSVCEDYGNDGKSYLDKHSGDAAKLTSFINSCLPDAEVKYVWSDHDRYASFAYDYASESVIESGKNSSFVYGAGKDGELGTQDDENYYVFALSMADMAAPKVLQTTGDKYTGGVYEENDKVYTYDANVAGIYDDRYSSGFHTAEERNAALDLFTSGAAKLDKTKPLFVVSHQPLFARRGDNDFAYAWASRINEVAETMDVAFFFGHNHKYDLLSDYYYEKGDTIKIAIPNDANNNKDANGEWQGTDMKINFSHFCAGYLQPTTESETTRKGVILGISINSESIRYNTICNSGIYTNAKNEEDIYKYNPEEGMYVNVILDRMNYITGEKYYPLGADLDLKVVYKGEDITDEITVEGYNKEQLGKQTLTITNAAGLKAYYEIEVYDPRKEYISNVTEYVDEETGLTIIFDKPYTGKIACTKLPVVKPYKYVYYAATHQLDKTVAYEIEVDEGTHYTVKIPMEIELKNPGVVRESYAGEVLEAIDIAVENATVSCRSFDHSMLTIGEDRIGEPAVGKLYEPDVVYVPADSFEAGSQYILVGIDGNTGQKYAYADNNGEEGAVAVNVKQETIQACDGTVYNSYISNKQEEIAFTAISTAEGIVLTNGTSYISNQDKYTLISADEDEKLRAKFKYSYTEGRSRIQNENGQYIYYSVHTENGYSELWNWSSNIDGNSNSNSSRDMWLYKAVEVPSVTTDYYWIDTTASFTESAPADVTQTLPLDYKLMFGDKVVDTTELNGTWSFEVCPDKEYDAQFEPTNGIKGISNNGVVSFNHVEPVEFVKINYSWENNTVSRYVRIVPHYQKESCSHSFATIKTEDKVRFDCLYCSYSYHPDGLGNEGASTSSVSDMTISGLQIPETGRSLDKHNVSSFTVSSKGDYKVTAMDWQVLDGANWRSIQEDESICSDLSYRTVFIVENENKAAFTEDITITANENEAVVLFDEKGRLIVLLPWGEDSFFTQIDDSIFVDEIADCTYTSKAIKPAIRVLHEDKELKAGVDYTVTYKNNTNVNAIVDGVRLTKSGEGIFKSAEAEGFRADLPYAVVTGKGNYKGTYYINFNIVPACISEIDNSEAEGVVLTYVQQTVAGKNSFKPLTAVKYNQVTLKENKDYLVKITDTDGEEVALKNKTMSATAGTYLLTVTAQGNYAGCIRKEIYVKEKQSLIKNASVKLTKTNLEYKKEGATFVLEGDSPEVTVTVKEGKKVKTLVFEKDYTVSYRNNKSVGKATLIINGKGDYSGSKEVSFRINGVAFNTKNIAIEKIAEQIYTGNDILVNPQVTRKSDGVVLKEGVDYEISYKNNRKKGTATVTFKGLASAGFTGSIKNTFKISAAELRDDMLFASSSAPYSKKGAKLSNAFVRYNGQILIENKDYTVKYKNNRKVGETAIMTVTGKGNFKGTISREFTIEKQYISGLSVSVKPVAYNAKKKGAYKLDVVVKEGNTTLNKKDYIVTSEAITNEVIDKWYAGETVAPKITVAGAGDNYTGSVSIAINVYGKKLSSKNTLIQFASIDRIYSGQMVVSSFSVYYSEDAKLISDLKKIKDQDELAKQIKAARKEGKLRMLIAETDYTIKYGTNILAGPNKGVITVYGTGKYSGSASVKFEIKQKLF